MFKLEFLKNNYNINLNGLNPFEPKDNAMKRKISGFTLIESMLVIGFIATASVGVYGIYNKAQSISVANNESMMLNKFRDDIVGMYESSDSYLGIDNTILNQARITPFQMRDGSATNIINRFGGAVTVAPFTFGGAPNSGFRITYPQVKVSSCPNMAIALADRFNAITINGTAVKVNGDQGISPAAVASACDGGGGNVGANMVFEYVSSFQIASAAGVPGMAPAAGTQFKMAPTTGVCDLSSPDFFIGAGAVPADVRSKIIFTYKKIDNHAGICPSPPDYAGFITTVQNYKVANPSMSYTDVYVNLFEPILINMGNLASKATSISVGDTRCSSSSAASYGAAIAASYVPYSGNGCRSN